MDLERKAERFGRFVLVCAVVFRLFADGIPQRLLAQIPQQRLMDSLILLETGHNVRSSLSSEDAVPAWKLWPESSAPMFPGLPVETVPPEPEETQPVFTPEDAAALTVTDFCHAAPDLEALLTRPLDWELTGEAPTVLILHTHATESYTRRDEPYAESSPYRTLDEGYNMLSLGDRVATLLEAGGIRVLHDRSLHDYPSYTSAYSHARTAIREYLENYPTLRLVLDLHRDAADGSAGQLRTAAVIDGSPSAQLMLVMGTGNGGQSNPRWQEDLVFAAKLHVLLERQYPGLMRPISLRAQRFNQDLPPCAALVEIGAAGNTHAEALLAAEKLAEAILALKHGA